MNPSRKRKSIFDRYSLDTLRKFAREYKRNRELEPCWKMGHCAACAAVGTLFTTTQWNGPCAAAYFDDALAIALRIEEGYIDLEH